jgi:hypothetical protein
MAINDIPSNVSYGTVTGRFLLAYADGEDSNLFPDGAPAKGSILFTPSPAYVKNLEASPAPVTILPATIECQLDEDGYLLGTDGTRGVRLIATDDPSNNPVDWTWRVDFRLTDQEDVPTRGIPRFSFELPSESTVDLAALSPVTDSNGTFYLVGPRGDSGKSAYEIALDNGFVGTEAEWLASLEADSTTQLTTHINAATPHPAYDDMSSLTLLFENGLV